MSRAKEKKGNLSCFLRAWVSDTQVPLVLPWGEWGLYFAHVRAGGWEEVQPEAAGGKFLQSREHVPAGQPQWLLWFSCGFSMWRTWTRMQTGTHKTKAEEEVGGWAGIALTEKELCGLLLLQYQVPLPLSQEQQQPGVLPCSELPCTMFLLNFLISRKHLKCLRRGQAAEELFPCAQMWCTPKFQTRYWLRDSKEQGQGHGQHFLARPWRPAGPEAGRTTNVCKHSAENIHLLQFSMPRAGNGPVDKIFLDLVFSPLCLRNVESGFGDFEVTHLKASLDCS